MTLAEWAKRNRRKVSYVNGAAVVEDTRDKSLWGLTDFVVSTVTGGSIWLVPKPVTVAGLDEHLTYRNNTIRAAVLALPPAPIDIVIRQIVSLFEHYEAEALEEMDSEENFVASLLYKRFPEGEIVHAIDLNTELTWDHTFFKLSDRYYDAETPDGVTFWRSLPACARRKEAAK